MNAIIYIRVSTTEQAELGYSLKAQEETCIEYAKRNNYNVLKIFKEEGESAKTTNRTELQNLLRYIKENYKNINALIVYKIDRLSRDVYDTLSLRALFSKLNIDLKSVTEPFDNSPIGKFIATTFSSIAQLDNDIRSERSIIGMKQAILSGRWVWKAPFGYKFIQKEDGKSYIIPSENKAIVEKIFNDYIDGKGQAHISRELRALGANKSIKRVNEILMNPVYMGKIKTKFFEELITGIHEPIISELTYYKAQDILNKKIRVPYNSKYKEDFPLRRFLRCPVCNKKLTGSWSQGKTKKYPYYHCTNKGCSFKAIRKEKAEEIFIEYLKELQPSNDSINEFINQFKNKIKENDLANNKQKNNLSLEIKTLNERRLKIEELAIEGIFSKDRFQRKIKEVEDQISLKIVELENLEKTKIDIDKTIEYCKFFIKNIAEFWKNANIDIKKEFQSLIFPEGGYILEEKFRTPKIAGIFKAFMGSSDKKCCLVGPPGLEPGTSAL
jgi:site-specific DNA recombinase